MKKIDIVTVLISSTTLLLFCLCSYWLLSRYSEIQDIVSEDTTEEIRQIDISIKHLASPYQIDPEALTDQLLASKKALKGHQNDWLLLKQTLTSFVSILVIIVFSHLFFVYTLFRGVGEKKGR